MTPACRWPLHPVPEEGEALSSWLYRVACCYQLNLSELLRHEFGHYGLHDLDSAVPPALLEAIAQRSGIGLDQLRSMSLIGWTPWLLDSLDPDPSAFAAYVYQLSVLLPLTKRRTRTVPHWRAWIPNQAIHRGCPQCLHESGKHALLLMWQLPLLLSCPQHGCWLEPYLGMPGNFLRWEAEAIQPRPTSEAVAMMDHRTWQALMTGEVKLPRRRVHAGLWFRLLRTLLDELNTPLSHCPAQAWDIRWIWESCGHSVRAGQSFWHPYEILALPVQLQMLEAAATAIQLIEADGLSARGAQAELFLPEPMKEIADGRQPPKLPGEEVNLWRAGMAALEETIAEARHDPKAAQTFFNMSLFGRKDADSIQSVRGMLVKMGIPDDFLSHFSSQ